MYRLIACLLVCSSLFALPSRVMIISSAEHDANFNLTSRGSARAQALPNYFETGACVVPPDAIFGAKQSSAPNEGLAIIQTITPTSDHFGLPLHLGFPPENPAALAHFILTDSNYNGKDVLIVWEFAGIPNLVAAFGYQRPTLPSPATSDLTYILRFPITSSTKIAQICCQNVLAGDCVTPTPTPPSPTPIPPTPVPAPVSPTPPSPPAPPAPAPIPTPPSPPPPPVPPGFLPVVLVNSSVTVADTHIWVLIVSGKHQQFVSFNPVNSRGTVVPSTLGADSTSFVFSLNEVPLIGGKRVIYLPPIDSARIYFSIDSGVIPDKSLYAMDFITISSTISLETGLNLQESNYYFLYDKVEFTINPFPAPPTVQSNTFANPTAVDFFCLPLFLEMRQTVSPTYQSSGFMPIAAQSRFNLFTQFKSVIDARASATTNPLWSALLLPFPSVPVTPASVLRFASVQNAMVALLNPFVSPTTTIFPNDYLQNSTYGFDWARFAWTTFYANAGSNKLYFLPNEPSPPTASGNVNASNYFQFSCLADPPCTIDDANIFYQSSTPFFSGGIWDTSVKGTQPSPFSNFSINNSELNAVNGARDIAAAVAVGLFPLNNPSDPLQASYFLAQKTAGNYYTDNVNLPPEAAGTGPWYNLYAAAIHSPVPSPIVPMSTNIYTMPFDDELSQDGTHNIKPIGGEITITLGDLTGTVLPDPYTDATSYTVTVVLPSTGQPTVMCANPPGTHVPFTPGGFTIPYPITVPLILTGVSGCASETGTFKIWFNPPIMRTSLPGAAFPNPMVTGPGTASVTLGAGGAPCP